MEKGSEAWQIIEDSQCGVLVEAGDYEEMYRSLSQIIQEKAMFIKKHQKGRDYLLERFTKQKSINAYCKALQDLL